MLVTPSVCRMEVIMSHLIAPSIRDNKLHTTIIHTSHPVHLKLHSYPKFYTFLDYFSLQYHINLPPIKQGQNTLTIIRKFTCFDWE